MFQNYRVHELRIKQVYGLFNSTGHYGSKQVSAIHKNEKDSVKKLTHIFRGSRGGWGGFFISMMNTAGFKTTDQ